MQEAAMQAKLRITSIQKYGDPVTQETLQLSAVSATAAPYGPNGESEDNTYARYTPMANLSMTINNPTLLGKFTEGQTFYVPFILADQTPAADAPGTGASKPITDDQFAQAYGSDAPTLDPNHRVGNY